MFVRALRTAENDHAGMIVKVFWEWVAEAGPAHIQLVAFALEKAPDAAGARMFLVDDAKNTLGHGRES
ncbi:MAG: hypothetical protein OTJ45_03840 [Alphaproteobacteria bacterium]|nr:hypothetical protein [Alphaproteobacteria bacterium]